MADFALVWPGRVTPEGGLRVNEREDFASHLVALASGSVEVIVRRPFVPASPQFKRYYWGVVLDVLGDALGYFPPELHEEMKKWWHVTTTTTMSRDEFARFVGGVCTIAARDHGVVIPLPDRTHLRLVEAAA